ncbi:hypothetical protein F8388_014911 [Cannabis sativa]|uniref:Non-haem dioxygenase N-terminal domain-containing protein n=1 Tax=Cannabis sativa TaxID=3483 RepID=A0A7J6F654_CANSA|nr:hypothetical protein F8388_014911 [Cannabis sativa]KAF4404969.1 hypothetical protein G4B88_006355 [Cannabis sativa]
MESFQMAKDNTPLSLTQNFIVPESNRPQLSKVSTLDSIPIIDLSTPSQFLLDKITQACEEYGFFHIINHGVPQNLCKRMLTAISDLFKLPHQERSKLFSSDHNKEARILNYYLKCQNQEKVTMWSESFNHVLSNGRYKSVHHRAVTNKMLGRISVAMFYGPNINTWIGPIEELVDEEHPAVYRRYKFSEFLDEFARQEGTRRRVKEAFQISYDHGICSSSTP